MLESEVKKCMLITTPRAGKTLSRGALSIASFLNSRGYLTEILPLAYLVDYRDEWSYEEIETILKDSLENAGPVLVGVSNQFTGDYPICMEILKRCKQINEDIVSVVGGVHVTFLDSDSAKLPYVDIVVRGEGEWAMLDLATTLEKRHDVDKVLGITYMKDGEIIRNPDRPLGDLAELPPLDFGLLPPMFVQNIFIHGMLNRGCNFNCRFCGESAFWKKRRSFPVDRIIQEMISLDQVYNNPMHGIDDSMLYIGSEQFTQLAEEIRRQKIRLHPDFYIMSRVDSFLEDDLALVKETGINYVQLGIESASPKVLQAMNKKTSKEKILSCCVKLKKYGLKPYGLWMIGHPGDTPDEAEYSLDFMEYLLQERLMERVAVSVFAPCPGTIFFEQPEKFGIELLSDNWMDWSQYFVERPVCQLTDFSAEEIMRSYRKAHEIIDRVNPGALSLGDA
ncbi:MAG: radical SAM protein [Candidatus Electrothrix aestuarii]|uniref:Radical SAM protein n=1 Tax=Candidatus Electrothrix aestuarii TaxID=3062594 RepID=A0AAU8LVT0_9BACT|nr:radical SAM protein [Candidatus Electrothrix aestuarii]WPD21965.1 MAG: radical SAM protein [Candidatus Electrothrix sp. GW3-3]